MGDGRAGMRPLDQVIRDAFLEAARGRGVPAGEGAGMPAGFGKTHGAGLRTAERRSGSVEGVATNRLSVPNRKIRAFASACRRLSTASPSMSWEKPQAGGRGCAEPRLILAPLLSAPEYELETSWKQVPVVSMRVGLIRSTSSDHSHEEPVEYAADSRRLAD